MFVSVSKSGRQGGARPGTHLAVIISLRSFYNNFSSHCAQLFADLRNESEISHIFVVVVMILILGGRYVAK